MWAHVPIVGVVVGQRALMPRAKERAALAQERAAEWAGWLGALRLQIARLVRGGVSGAGGEAGGDVGDDAVAGGPLAQHAVAGGVAIAVMGRSVVGWRCCRHGVAGFVVSWRLMLSWWPWWCRC